MVQGTSFNSIQGILGGSVCSIPEEVIVHCTGVVTDHEIQELKKRIASGTTTADDVVLLNKVLEYVKSTTT